MSKALALLVTGLNTLGDGLKMMAAELQEGGEKAVLMAQVSAQEAKPEELKKAKETKTEAAPEIDEVKLREECTALVKEKVTAAKKPEVLECFKKFGIAKVSECPADKLEQLKINLGLIK